MSRQVKIIGGLGNQLFQFAFYIYISKKYPSTKLDISEFKKYKLHNGFELNKIINSNKLKEKIIENNFLKAFINKVYKFIPFNFYYYFNEHPKIRYNFQNEVNKKKYKYYIGYWQSREYFKKSINVIKENIEFSKLEKKNIELASKMNSENSIAIHVRRGDYLKNSDFYSLDTDYYKSAFEYIINKSDSLNKIKVYIFSNDFNWVEEKFKFIKNDVIFVDWNSKEKSYQDLYLISKAKNIIIANSTFSWWGAALSKDPKIIIAPKKWNKNYEKIDIYLKNWILI